MKSCRFRSTCFRRRPVSSRAQSMTSLAMWRWKWGQASRPSWSRTWKVTSTSRSGRTRARGSTPACSNKCGRPSAVATSTRLPAGVVKVDVDAVFLPSRLTKKLESQMVPANGIYLQNCKFGPMGEDLFAQTCLDELGVRRVEAFDITTDGACPANRPVDQKTNKKWKPDCAYVSTAAMHPFKKEAEWIKCFEATTAAFGS